MVFMGISEGMLQAAYLIATVLFIMALGGLIAISDRRYRSKSRATASDAVEAAEAPA